MNTAQGIAAVTAPIEEVSESAALADAVACADKPVVLRRAVEHWEVVRRATAGNDALVEYLRSRDTGAPVYTIVGQPEIAGRFDFLPDFTGLNFDSRRTSISDVLQHFMAASKRGIAIAIQAAAAEEIMRDWRQENPCKLVPDGVTPRLWLSTSARVAAHSDIEDNLACVAAGRRRFTLFPPEQLENLYLGPLLNSPGGVPVSSVNGWSPDLAQHPGFATALASAQTSTLEPGDVLFIPALWWHAVEALEEINLLINYWWGGTASHGISPYNALTHAALAISQLSAAKRRRWQHYFNALVFRLEGDPAAHLPPDLADLISTPGDEQVRDILQKLVAALSTD